MSLRVLLGIALVVALGAQASVGPFKSISVSYNTCDAGLDEGAVTFGNFWVTAAICYNYQNIRLYVFGPGSCSAGLCKLTERSIVDIGSARPSSVKIHKYNETALILMLGAPFNKGYEIFLSADGSTISLGRTTDQYTPVPWKNAISMVDAASNKLYFIGSGNNATGGFYTVDLTPYVPLRINRAGSANFGEFAAEINTLSYKVNRPYGFLLNQSSMATIDYTGQVWQKQGGGEDSYDWFVWVDKKQDLGILSGVGENRHNVQMFNVATGHFGEMFDIYWNIWGPAVKDGCLYYIAQTTPEVNTLFQMQVPTSLYGPNKLLTYTTIKSTNRMKIWASATDNSLYILDVPTASLSITNVACSA